MPHAVARNANAVIIASQRMKYLLTFTRSTAELELGL